MIDILVLNYNDAVTTTSFVNLVKDYSCVRKILVVDNHSKDNSLECLKALENDKVIVIDSGENRGYGAGNNFGIKYLTDFFHSKYILISNPDVIVDNDCLQKLENFLEKNNDYSMVSALMLNAHQKVGKISILKKTNLIGFLFSPELIFSKIFNPLYDDLNNRKNESVVDVFSLPGSMFLVDANKMIQDGMFDENQFLYFEEYVLGLKMELAKYKVALLPQINFIHNHSTTIKKNIKSSIKRKKIYLKSYRYVLKKYFHASVFTKLLSYAVSFIALVEIILLDFSRKKT